MNVIGTNTDSNDHELCTCDLYRTLFQRMFLLMSLGLQMRMAGTSDKTALGKAEADTPKTS